MKEYKFTFVYTNGEVEVKYFASVKDGMDWAHNEGDHLLDYTYE